MIGRIDSRAFIAYNFQCRRIVKHIVDTEGEEYLVIGAAKAPAFIKESIVQPTTYSMICIRGGQVVKIATDEYRVWACFYYSCNSIGLLCTNGKGTVELPYERTGALYLLYARGVLFYFVQVGPVIVIDIEGEEVQEEHAHLFATQYHIGLLHNDPIA